MSAEFVLEIGCGTGVVLHLVLEDLHHGRLSGLNTASGMLPSTRRNILVPKVGVEPTRVLPQRCLRPSRLPFRHSGNWDSRLSSLREA